MVSTRIFHTQPQSGRTLTMCAGTAVSDHGSIYLCYIAHARINYSRKLHYLNTFMNIVTLHQHYFSPNLHKNISAIFKLSYDQNFTLQVHLDNRDSNILKGNIINTFRDHRVSPQLISVVTPCISINF